MHYYLLFASSPEPLFICFYMMLCHCDFRSYRFIYRPSGLLGLLFYSHAALLLFVCDSGFARVYLITRRFVTLVYTRAGRYQRLCDASRASRPSTGGDGVYFPLVYYKVEAPSGASRHLFAVDRY